MILCILKGKLRDSVNMLTQLLEKYDLRIYALIYFFVPLHKHYQL